MVYQYIELREQELKRRDINNYPTAFIQMRFQCYKHSHIIFYMLEYVKCKYNIVAFITCINIWVNSVAFYVQDFSLDVIRFYALNNQALVRAQHIRIGANSGAKVQYFDVFLFHKLTNRFCDKSVLITAVIYCILKRL